MELPDAGSVEHEVKKTANDFFPYVEDWVAIQGGRPRVFRDPARPKSRWLVVHVYEEHEDSKERFQSGAVVDTAPPGDKFTTRRVAFKRENEDGQMVERDIRIPSFMFRYIHGVPCEERSINQQGDTYQRIRSQTSYNHYIENLQASGYEELRFGLGESGFVMRPVPIRPPRPTHR